MTPGVALPLPVTEKESVKHLDAPEASLPLVAAVNCPFKMLASETVTVEGPLMAKVVKSSRSWNDFYHRFSLCFVGNSQFRIVGPQLGATSFLWYRDKNLLKCGPFVNLTA